MKRSMDWTRDLREELEPDIRAGVNKQRRQGNDRWGDARRTRVKVEQLISPIFPGLVPCGVNAGMSQIERERRVQEFAKRHESGLSLWENAAPDTESFEGTELTEKEASFICQLLSIRDSHLERGKKWGKLDIEPFAGFKMFA